MHYKVFPYVLLSFITFYSIKLKAQNKTETSCEIVNPINIDDLVKSSDIFIQNNLPTINAKERKAKKVLLNNYNYLKTIFINKKVIKIDFIEKELITLTSKIIDANPSLQGSNFNIFYALDYTANASSMGNNIFFVYPGLFEILENDEQLTFVLCHEIAHQVLKHYQKSIEENINLSKAEINYQKILNIYRDKRELELNADSLGFEFYTNLKHPRTEAIKALNNLKNSDSIIYSQNIDIKKQFNFKDYPFKSFWLNENEKILNINSYQSDFRNLDSLRTHPNIDIRVSAIKQSSTEYNNYQTSSRHLDKIKTWQNNYYLCAIKDSNKYDLQLFLALKKHNENPNDEFAIEMIASTLLKIYKSKKEKQFSKYIQAPNPFAKNTSFSELKRFLKNTEAREIRKIGLWFCNSVKAKSQNLIKIHETFKRLNQ